MEKTKEKFERTPEEVKYKIEYLDSNGFNLGNCDIFQLIFKDKKVLASYAYYADCYMTECREIYEAELPRDSIEGLLREFDETGSGNLELNTLVKKDVKNRWGEYGQTEEYVKEYSSKVKVQLSKSENKPKMRIKFEDM